MPKGYHQRRESADIAGLFLCLSINRRNIARHPKVRKVANIEQQLNAIVDIHILKEKTK